MTDITALNVFDRPWIREEEGKPERTDDFG